MRFHNHIFWLAVIFFLSLALKPNAESVEADEGEEESALDLSSQKSTNQKESEEAGRQQPGQKNSPNKPPTDPRNGSDESDEVKPKPKSNEKTEPNDGSSEKPNQKPEGKISEEVGKLKAELKKLKKDREDLEKEKDTAEALKKELEQDSAAENKTAPGSVSSDRNIESALKHLSKKNESKHSGGEEELSSERSADKHVVKTEVKKFETGDGGEGTVKKTVKKTVVKSSGSGSEEASASSSSSSFSSSSGGASSTGTKTIIKKTTVEEQVEDVNAKEDMRYRTRLEMDSNIPFFDSKHGRIIMHSQRDSLAACKDYLPRDACKAMKPLCEDLQKHMSYVKGTVNDPEHDHNAKLLKNLEEINQLLPSVKKTAPLIRLILDEDSEDEFERIIDAHLRFKQECSAHKQMCYKTHIPAHKRKKACALYDDICCCDNYKFHRYYQSIVSSEKHVESKEAKGMRRATRRLIEASCAATCGTCPTRFRIKEYAQNVRHAFDCNHLKIPKGHDVHIHFEQDADEESSRHYVHMEREESSEEDTRSLPAAPAMLEREMVQDYPARDNPLAADPKKCVKKRSGQRGERQFVYSDTYSQHYN
uniref:Uncharacterized protein n=1 Tax=Ditylenchus dipsaci TaxID=166011 RepID=A0A915DV59_9BILA